MARTTVWLLLMMFAVGALARNLRQPGSQESRPADPGTIKVTIATVGPLLGPPTDHFKVGEQIPVTISMTNTSTQPTYACLSSDLYQDVPRLTKNGDVLPYAKWQTSLLRINQDDQTCQDYDLPERMILKSNEPTFVDFLIIADDSRIPTGAQSWYDPLAPGVYELSIQRRFDCCDGPTVESNKISFEVAP